MPVDGGGVVTRPPSPIPVTGQNADAPQVNTPVDDLYNIANMLVFLDGRKSLRGDIPMNGYKASNAANATAPQDYVTLSQVQAMIAAVSQLFPGFLMSDTTNSTYAPEGWLYANGQEVLRSAYPALWARISVTGDNLSPTQAAKTAGQYGPGNGTTTFTLPNLYADGGYFIRPMTAGRAIGNIQTDDNKSHSHTASSGNAGLHSHAYTIYYPQGELTFGPQSGRQSPIPSQAFTNESGSHVHPITVNASGGTESRPKNIAYPVLLKT